MRIERMHVRTRELQRKDPHWRTATYSAGVVPAIYVGLEAGGSIGVGATSAKIRHNTLNELVGQLTEVARPLVEGAEFLTLRDALERSNPTIHPRAMLALDLAIHDLLGKLAGVPAEVLWGGTHRRSVSVIRMVGLKDPHSLRAAVAPLIEAGYSALKIKGGDSVAVDIARARAIRAEFGDQLQLMFDANGSYSPDEAIMLCRGLESHGVSLVEQPVPYDDIEGLTLVTRESPIDIVADQYVFDARTAFEVCSRGAADAISIKITKMGTISECLRVITVCESFGVTPHLGGSAAPALVDGAACRLALSQTSIGRYAEVGESLGLSGDVDGGPTIRLGEARSKSGHGLGGPSQIFTEPRWESGTVD